jgi:glutamine phosphoribosylpyrophosphate amidotransferase
MLSQGILSCIGSGAMCYNPLQIYLEGLGQKWLNLKNSSLISYGIQVCKGPSPIPGGTDAGHLRYGTQGKNKIDYCHPFIKRDIKPSRNLALAGNFNLVNVDELFGLVNIDRVISRSKATLLQ